MVAAEPETFVVASAEEVKKPSAWLLMPVTGNEFAAFRDCELFCEFQRHFGLDIEELVFDHLSRNMHFGEHFRREDFAHTGAVTSRFGARAKLANARRGECAGTLREAYSSAFRSEVTRAIERTGDCNTICLIISVAISGGAR
jgi:hypothetical protein